jgi:hypothetical protein
MPPEGKYTGERVADQNPRKYRAIVRLLSEGKSVNSIQKQTKTAHATIEAISRIEAPTNHENNSGGFKSELAAWTGSLVSPRAEGLGKALQSVSLS